MQSPFLRSPPLPPLSSPSHTYLFYFPSPLSFLPLTSVPPLSLLLSFSSLIPISPPILLLHSETLFLPPLIGDPGITLGKILGVAVVRRRVLRHFGNGTQQFNKSGFIPVNLSKSVEFEILQVGKKLNEQ